MDEMLPLLEEKDGVIMVKGSVKRSQAHGIHPVFHGTAVIVAMMPDGRIIFADKTQKQIAKGRRVTEGVRICDIFGGHMSYSDIPEEDLKNGLSQDTFRKCAARELSEELLCRDRHGKYLPLPVEEEKLIPIGFYSMENDHNREYSWAYLYPLSGDKSYASEDTLIMDGVERKIPQPLLILDAEDIIEQYFSKNDGSLQFDDAIGRIVAKDGGETLLQVMNQAKKCSYKLVAKTP